MHATLQCMAKTISASTHVRMPLTPLLAYLLKRHVRAVQILVFSMWNDVLGLLSHALSGSHVPHIWGRGKRGLREALGLFRTSNASNEASAGANDINAAGQSTSPARSALRRGSRLRVGHKRKLADPEPARVLLLQMSQAAAGLNLTEAQHALLVEPSTNPAIEAQVRAVLECFFRTFYFGAHVYMASARVAIACRAQVWEG
jgi:hypothetical protein